MITTLLDAAQNVFESMGNAVKKVDKAISYQKDQSLSQFAKLTQVEPIAVVSKDLINLEYMPDVMQSVLSVFTGYYMQAVGILTSIDSVKIIKILDRLNPDRDASGYLLSLEATFYQFKDFYKYKLPSLEDSSKDDKGASIKPISLINEASNLAVGKLIEVNFNDKNEKGGSNKVSVTVRIRIAPAILSNLAVEKIIVSKTDDISLTERYHAWRAGRISFIRDLIFCQDLIDERKKLLIDDQEGVYSEIVRRVNNAKKYGLLTQNPSLVSASSVFVVSEDVAKDIEIKFGGSLENKRILDKVFENTYAMMLVVVDRQYDRVNFYTRGISSSANYSIKEIKSANKNKGIDIMDVMKSFNMGQSPSF